MDRSMPRSMLPIVAVGATLLLSAAVAQGVVVANTNVEWHPFQKPRTVSTTDPNGSVHVTLVYEEAYAVRVFQNAAATDYTGTDAIYTPDESGMKRLRFESGLTDEGVDWYLVAPGTPFGPQAIANGSATPLYVNLHAAAPIVPPPGDFYLGLATRLGGPIGPLSRDTFGWLRLSHNNDGTLAMTGNAIAYHALGIGVGTTTELPEPGDVALGACAMLGAWATLRTIRRPEVATR